MSRPDHPTAPLVVAYVLTDYPQPSQTFLRQEVVGIDGDQVRVVPVAINPPRPTDLRTDADRRESDRTYYIKATPLASIVRIVGGVTLRHPVVVLRRLLAGLRSGGLDGGLAVKRAFQAIEGLLVWRHCETQGVRHLHAHFGGATSFIAANAVAFANEIGDGGWTWSVTIHGPHDFMNEDRSGLTQILHTADATVAISDYCRAQLLRLADPVDWDRITVVRCGIDLDRFGFRDVTQRSGPMVVLTTGRLAPEKGQWVLIDALALLRDRGVDVRARIIGGGPFEAALRQRAADRGVADRVEFLGVQTPDEVFAELHAADVFCLPSFAEGLPVSIMEALAVGVPVVSTQIAGIPELVEHDVSGSCVRPGSPALIADELQRLHDDAGLGHRWAVEGRRRVCDQHDARRTNDQLRDLFVRLAGIA